MLLQSLNIIIEDILEQGSKTRTRKERPKKPEEVVDAAFSKLTIRSAPAKLALPGLLAGAREQQESLQEYLALFSTEPVVLSHAVNIWVFSRPELVPDERGRQLPVHTDKYTSASVLEAVHSSLQGVAIWTYLVRLLELLQNSNPDKAYRALILQEISNICQLEFNRTQSLFKRHVQTGTGSKWFKRISNAYDNAGNARVNLKGNPEDLTRTEPQLHYMLRVCQPKLTAPNAANWAKKLGELHRAHPEERENLQEREADSLGDLAIIIGFIQDLAPVIAMPSFSNNKGQAFISRFQALEKELSDLKNLIDLRDFVVPIDNLLEPGVAEGALKALDEFTIEKAGTKMGSLYDDIIEDSLSDLESQYEQVKAKMEQGLKYELPKPSMPTESTELRVQQRRQKEKTRPPHSSIL